MGDLDVPCRHSAVQREPQVSLGSTDDELRLAEPDDLAVELAVVEDGQDWHRRPRSRTIRASRPSGVRSRPRLDRRALLLSLRTGDERLANVVVRLEDGGAS